MKNKEETYIPGTCNIGAEALRKRKRTALMVSLFTILCIFMIELFSPGKIWKALMFLPFTICAICWLQVFTRFCVYFGVAGFFKIKEGSATSIENKTDLHHDRMKAIKIILSGIAIGLALTSFYYFLPYLTT